jgi:hypothetical protein
MINVTDYGHNQFGPDSLQAVKDGMARSANAKVLSERKISIDSNPGVEFEMGSESYRARVRCYIIGSKLLVIIGFADGGNLLPPDTSRILDSLRLLRSKKQ